jgi:glycosyltransferase involved in cell wall biosynthesis
VSTAREGRLRVLFVLDHARIFGGAERFVTGLATNMPRDRIEPWVCSTRRGEDLAVRWLSEAGVRHVDLGRTATWHLHRMGDLIRLLRRERFDVVHAHMFGSNVWGTLIGRVCRVPVVLTQEHTWSFGNDRLRKWIDGRVIGRLATRCLTVSAANRERMINLEHVPPDKVVVMPVAHVPHAPSLNGGIRSELGLDATTPLVGVAAVFRPEKALEVILDAHARMRAEILDAHLVIAGDGPCREQLERRIVELGIQSSVHLLGPRTDVDSILREVDAGVMSSDYEGMPLFALECFAAGVPLVATAVGGMPEIVEHGRSGLLVPPRDSGALAAALGRILTDRALANRLTTQAAASYPKFTVDAVANRYADLYERLLAEAR